jgi:hypothetical protein
MDVDFLGMLLEKAPSGAGAAKAEVRRLGVGPCTTVVLTSTAFERRGLLLLRGAAVRKRENSATAVTVNKIPTAHTVKLKSETVIIF